MCSCIFPCFPPICSPEMVYTVMCLPHGVTCFFSPKSEELHEVGVMHPDFHAGKHCTSQMAAYSYYPVCRASDGAGTSHGYSQCVQFSFSFFQRPISFSLTHSLRKNRCSKLTYSGPLIFYQFVFGTRERDIHILEHHYLLLSYLAPKTLKIASEKNKQTPEMNCYV